MKYLVISDIHANLDALDAVLADCADETFDHTLMLGDLVGYGAEPNEVVHRIREMEDSVTMVRGNHDKVAVGLEPLDAFNVAARSAAEWTLEELTAENREFVRALPKGPSKVAEGLEICHGSPLDEDMYILDSRSADLAFRASEASVALFGHSHIPSCFVEEHDEPYRSAISFISANELEVIADRRYLINPGSVGQPRDADPRAAYVALEWGDTRRVEWRRVDYDVARAAEKIYAAGLPRILGERLFSGN